MTTLYDHRCDQRLWVAQLLAGTPGHEAPISEDEAARIQAARDSGDDGAAAGLERWDRADPRDPDVANRNLRVLRAVGIRVERRKALDEARKARAAQEAREGPATGPPEHVSATGGQRE